MNLNNDSFIDSLLNIVPYFKVVQFKGENGRIQYEWVCKGVKNAWVESTISFDTRESCIQNFLSNLTGYGIINE